MSAIQPQLLQMATEAAEAEACQLVDMELTSEGGGRVLKVFLEKTESPLQLDDCAAVSDRLSALLDVNDLILGEYRLEVSSPGLTRPLKKREDFIRFQGQLVVVQTYATLPAEAFMTQTATEEMSNNKKTSKKKQTVHLNKKSFKGALQGVEDEEILILTEESLVRIPLKSISKAHLDFVF